MEPPSERTPLLGRATFTSVWRRTPVAVQRAAHVGAFGLVLFLCALWAAPGLLNRRQRLAPIRSKITDFSTPAAILAVGDWGRDGHSRQKSVAAALAHVAHAEPGVRIVSTGDNFYDNGVKSIADVQFNSSYEDVYNIYKSLRSTTFWPVLGNHDHLGDPLAQIAYSARSAQWDMPARFYARPFHPSLLLIFLDTTPYLHDKEGIIARRNGFHHAAQTEWLENTLANAPQSHFLVFGHHNMYSGSTAGHGGNQPIRKNIEPVLKRYADRVLAYVSGHEHALMHMRVKGMDHFVSGGGSELDEVTLLSGQKQREKWRKHGVVGGEEAPFVQSLNGFFKFQFLPAQGIFNTTVYDASGKVAYQFSKTVPTPAQVWGARNGHVRR